MPEILIEKLGSGGDGIGWHNGKPVYVAGALPGERVRIDDHFPHPRLLEILIASEHRRDPPCVHFGVCGGCTFQHLSLEQQLAWKHQQVAHALSRVGIPTEVQPTIASPASSRRRATVTAQRSHIAEDGLTLGFKEIDGENLLNVAHCTILSPELERELANLRPIAKTLLRGSEEIQIAVNVCDNGLDFDFLLPQQPSESMTAAFVRAMARTHYLRGSVNGDIVIEGEKPFVTFGRSRVELPPGAFLQAVKSAEIAISELVCKHLSSRKRVLDLFCGCGTFALRLAELSQVHAVELDAAPLAALLAASGTDGLRKITVEQRDLHALPLTAQELKGYDGLCLDPPRAGAEEQARLVANTQIRSIAYVSCNPKTLARDAAILIGGGFELQRVVPIDQFVYSPHVEVVALFSKKPVKSGRSIFR